MKTMSNNKKTIVDFNASNDKLEAAYNKYRSVYNVSSDLDLIFKIALNDKERFPAINFTDKEVSYEHYVERWVKSYADADNISPSQHIANPKASCSDPAVKMIVKIATDSSEEKSNEQERHHNLFMSAENIQGDLLEEFIAVNIRCFGWLWCKGNILRAVDFCSEDGAVYLQVKNKNNTENSSSSAIRAGTEIKKWYRLGTSRRDSICLPSYKWAVLNKIINENNKTNNKCELSEEAYIKFLNRVVSGNKKIVCDR